MLQVVDERATYSSVDEGFAEFHVAHMEKLPCERRSNYGFLVQAYQHLLSL